MTEKAESIIAKPMDPGSWLYPPEPDHPMWLKWKEIYGISPPIPFEYKLPKFEIGCGWRDTVIQYDENYRLMHAYKLECRMKDTEIQYLEDRLRIAESRSAFAPALKHASMQMPIRVSSAADKGNLQAERIGLEALEDLNLKDYLICDTRFATENSCEVGQRTAYWFQNQPLGRGNQLILYTRQGNACDEERDGRTYHFRFRGHSSPLYTDPKAVPAIIKMENWCASKL